MSDGERGRRHGMGVLSTITEGVGVAFDALVSNKVRSGLTILGVTIGVLVVMVMAAIIQGVNRSFSDIIASRGPTTFYVAHASFAGSGISTGLEEEEPAWFRNPPLDADWTRELARLPGIDRVSALADLSQSAFRAEWSGRRADVSLFAVGSDYMEIDNGEITDGRFFTESEERRRTPVAVVDSAVAADLFGGLDPIGRDVRLATSGDRGATFRIVGVYRPPANLFAGLATHYVLVPFASADKYLPVWDRLITFVVRPEPGIELQEAMDLVHARMRQIRDRRPGQEDDFELITEAQILDLWNNLTGILFTVMVGLSAVGLLVGGIGVIGIMMISVTERTREIGVRKSMGARRRDILWQFLVEAATLTGVGGGAGLALGGLIVWGLNTWTPVPAQVPMWSIVAALAASAVTGIGFGLYPASRAARLDPVDALRYE